VLDRRDSAARLVALERSNLFVSRLERGDWFRVHSLFAEYARTRPTSVEPWAPTVIHRRAAVWLRSHGLAAEAVMHAAAAGDHELVAELLVEHHLPLIRSGAGGTVLRWVRTLAEASSSSIPSSRRRRPRPRCWSAGAGSSSAGC
jgi:ATP/maltotriose-dependent transcriptional regulator MalT